MTVPQKSGSRKSAQGTMKFLFACCRYHCFSLARHVLQRRGSRVAVQKTNIAWDSLSFARTASTRRPTFVEVLELAQPEAGKIALRAGNADIVVTDWLWVSRERGLGAD